MLIMAIQVKLIDMWDKETLKSVEEYCETTVDSLFTTKQKSWFVDYKAIDSSEAFQAHPGTNVVESYPLSSVEPPTPVKADYRLPDNINLTTVQKDAVRLAASRFQQRFETGETKGFLLGN